MPKSIGRSFLSIDKEFSMLNDFQVFDYEDIQLIPAKCIVKSRSEADASRSVQYADDY